jgi:hypothetical protein
MQPCGTSIRALREPLSRIAAGPTGRACHHWCVFGDDASDENFEETLRSIARELGRSVERAVDRVDLDEFAEAVGVDPVVAREWVESTGSWLRAHAEALGEEVTLRSSKRPSRAAGSDDPLRGAGPHPLDLPTEEQGLALAALDSGRWTVEPGTDSLAAKGDGPGPSDALGIVRELRVRDWIAADGEVTLVGRHALSRWLDSTTPG